MSTWLPVCRIVGFVAYRFQIWLAGGADTTGVRNCGLPIDQSRTIPENPGIVDAGVFGREKKYACVGATVSDLGHGKVSK